MNRPSHMTADEFLAWAETQPKRYELYRGQVIEMMSPERARHVRAKHRMARRLEETIERADLSCEVFADGMTVRIDDFTVYEPDALVRCGPELPGDATEVTDPIIVVEVLSPSSQSIDTGTKLEGYFQLETVQHYLVVNPETGTIAHYRRDGTWTIVRDGELVLDPPGLTLELP